MGEQTSVEHQPPVPLGDSLQQRDGISAYVLDEEPKEIRQGEVLTHVAQYTYDPVSGRAAEVYRSYVIVGSQDCDLLRDYEALQRQERSQLNGLLLYEAIDAAAARDQFQAKKQQDIWRRVIQNNDERYHYLEAAQLTPALLIDFRLFFTMPSPELYRQCTLAHGAQRPCRLDNLYREHFQNRAASYQQRVGLPRLHTKPAAANQ